MVEGAHQAELINATNNRELVNSMCCPEKTDECISRKCDACCRKGVEYKDYDPTSIVSYHQWERDTVSAKPKTNKGGDASLPNADGEGKKFSITVKKKLQKSAIDVVTDLDESVKDYMAHKSRIVHQYKTLKHLKENVTENDLCIHVDFSENYACKYATETQAVHFGASRASVTLHTGAAYAARLHAAVLLYAVGIGTPRRG